MPPSSLTIFSFCAHEDQPPTVQVIRTHIRTSNRTLVDSAGMGGGRERIASGVAWAVFVFFSVAGALPRDGAGAGAAVGRGWLGISFLFWPLASVGAGRDTRGNTSLIVRLVVGIKTTYRTKKPLIYCPHCSVLRRRTCGLLGTPSTWSG
jgi:hypothetical protein